jgi:hypothetical protein
MVTTLITEIQVMAKRKKYVYNRRSSINKMEPEMYLRSTKQINRRIEATENVCNMYLCINIEGTAWRAFFPDQYQQKATFSPSVLAGKVIIRAKSKEKSGRWKKILRNRKV